MTVVVRSSTYRVPPARLFAFHQDVANLGRISPPVPRFTPISAPSPTRAGDLQEFTLGLGPLKVRWAARVTRFDEGRLLEDVQERGPFRQWRHQHRVSPAAEGSRLTDVVVFRALPTRAGAFAEWLLLAPGIHAMFAWRHWKTRQLLDGLAREE